MNKINQATKNQANSFGLIRYTASLAIVLYHYNKLTGSAHNDTNLPWFSILKPFYIHGGELVELFFMISGFCFILFYKDRIENERIGIIRLIIHRYFRILPSYWLSTCLVILFTYLSTQFIGSTITGAGGEVKNALFFLLNVMCLNFTNPINGVTWFLAVNIFCYIWYYFVLTIERGLKKKIMIVGSIVGASIFFSFYAESIFANIARGLASFGIGGEIAIINNYLSTKKQDHRRAAILSGIALICTVVGLVRFVNHSKYLWLIEVYLLFPLIIIFITNCSPIKDYFSKKTFVALGEYSYTIYIFQTAGMILSYMVCKMIGWANWYSPRNLLLTLCCVLVVGIALDVIYEKPIKNHIKNMEGKVYEKVKTICNR